MVAVFRAPSVYLQLLTGKGLITDFLAVEALRWALPGGEHRRIGGLSSQVEVLTIYKSSCLAALRYVDNHRTVHLIRVLPTKLSNVSDINLVLSPKGFHRP